MEAIMPIIVLLFALSPFIISCQTTHSPNDSSHPFVRKQNQIDHYYLQNQSDLHYIKGEQYSKKLLHTKAISSFKEALIFNPRSMVLRIRLAEELLSGGQNLEAYELLQVLHTEQPKNKKIQLYLAEFYKKHQLHKKALNEYNEILKQNPKDSQTLYQKAFLHFHQSEYKQAERILKELKDDMPENDLYKLYYLQAQIYRKKNQPDLAFSALKKVVSLQPQFLLPILDMFFTYAETNYSHKLIPILEEYQENIGSQPQVSLLLAHLYQQHNYKDKVIELLQFLVEENPKNWKFQLNLAKMWSQKTGYEKQALNLMKSIIQAHPKASPDIYIIYADLLYQQQSFNNLSATLKTAHSLFPENTNILLYKALVHQETAQTNEAISCLKAILKMNNNHVNALNFLAFIYVETNQNLKLAEQLAIKALKLSPKNSYILDTAGWVLFKNGKLDQALNYLEQAYADNTAESLIAAHLAEVYYEMNMLDKSIELYKKAIGLETDEGKRKELQQKLLFIQMDV